MKFQTRNVLSIASTFLSVIVFLCSSVQAQRNSNSKILITYEITGSGPNYSVQIHSNGTVIYEGKDEVKVKGKRRYKISTDKVEELIKEFQRINYFSLKDYYESNLTDAGSTITSISIDGRQKRIVNEYGPKELQELENKIEEIAVNKEFTAPVEIKLRLDYFYRELTKDPSAKGIIINYGTKRNVSKREADVRKAARQRGYVISSVKFVGRIRRSGIKTVFRVVNGEKTIDF